MMPLHPPPPPTIPVLRLTSPSSSSSLPPPPPPLPLLEMKKLLTSLHLKPTDTFSDGIGWNREMSALSRPEMALAVRPSFNSEVIKHVHGCNPFLCLSTRFDGICVGFQTRSGGFSDKCQSLICIFAAPSSTRQLSTRKCLRAWT